MRLVFTDQYANLLFLLNGLVILVFLYIHQKKRKRAMKFGNYETLKKVAGKDLIRSDTLLMVTRILAITSLLVGLSSPVLVQQVQGVDEDFVIALDRSASMFTSDVEPTRFEAAGDIAQDFIGDLGNSSRVGLVSYSGNVSETVDPTLDHERVAGRIEGLEIGEVPGTATGDAVSSSVSMLMDSERDKTVMLLTDGTNTVGQSIEEAAGYADRHNVTVNPIGIGEGEVELEDDNVIEGEDATRADFPNLNEEELQLLGNRTGGEARFVTDRDGIEEAFVDLEEQEVERDISRYLFLFAGFLLVFEAFLRTTDFEVIP